MTRLARLAVVVAALGFASQLTAADPPASGKYWVFLGTYTGGKGGSKGIYRCELDVATGKLSEPELAAEVASPSFLTLRPDGKVLYAVGETGGKDGGGVFAYTVDAASGKLAKLAESTSGGAGGPMGMGKIPVASRPPSIVPPVRQPEHTSAIEAAASAGRVKSGTSRDEP